MTDRGDIMLRTGRHAVPETQIIAAATCTRRMVRRQPRSMPRDPRLRSVCRNTMLELFDPPQQTKHVSGVTVCIQLFHSTCPPGRSRTHIFCDRSAAPYPLDHRRERGGADRIRTCNSRIKSPLRCRCVTAPGRFARPGFSAPKPVDSGHPTRHYSSRSGRRSRAGTRLRC